jgi:hypothetical protein
MAVSRQWISKHAYNNIGTVESGVFCWVHPRLYNDDPRPSERIIEKRGVIVELIVGCWRLGFVKVLHRRL